MSEPIGGNYYRVSAEQAPAYPKARGTMDARVCVVGGGFAGLNTALGLLERGFGNVTLLESSTVGFGASGRNGGFVFSGYSCGESDLLRLLGPNRAKTMYARTQDAVSLIRQRTDRYSIDCERVDGGVLWANWFRDPNVLEGRRRLLSEHFDTEWRPVVREELRALVHSDRYSAALFEPEAFHFHPLKYARGLARAIVSQGGEVYEHSAVTALQKSGAGWRIHTAEATIEAEHVVLACGGYLSGLVPAIDASVLPIATYIVVTEPLGERAAQIMNTNAAVYDTRFAFDYYRLLPDTRLLWGGRISVLDRAAPSVERLLRRDIRRVFPQLEGVRVDYAWSGLMSYARHEMPQIGQHAPGLWYAQAFGGHGVAPTTVAGEVLAAAIAQDNPAWREYAPFGLQNAMKPWGFFGAQATYTWLQAKDAWREWWEVSP